jgi:tetratricopeptide (TPR) repeat protein
MRYPGAVVTLAILLCHTAGVATQAADTAREAQQYFEEGEKAIAENRLDAAGQAYEKLAHIDPTVPEVRAKLGLIYYMQSRCGEAVPQLRTALRLKPGLPNAGTLLAICYAELGRYSEALAGLENAFGHSPDAKLRRLTGLQLLRSYTGLGQREKAVQVALQLSHLYPDDPEILYDTGHLFGDLAYSSMKRLAAVAPDSVWVLEASGEKYEAQGAYDAAIVQYRKVIATEPARPDIHFRLGHALLARTGALDRYAEALGEFQKEYDLSGSNSAAYEIGEIYRKKGQSEQARQYFAIAIKDQPDFEEAQVGLARVLLQLDRPEQALPHLQQALKLNPENEVSHYQLARVYAALGNTAAQTQELREFQRLRQAKQAQQTLLSQGQFQLSDVTRQTIDSDAK